MLLKILDNLRNLVQSRVNLTSAYVGALSLTACVLLSSYWLLTDRVTSDVNKAEVINAAGMQRSLSQRIALMAREVDNASSDSQAELMLEKFVDATDRFDTNHEYLIDLLSARASPEVIALYQSPYGVDARSRHYIALAREFERWTRTGLEPEEQQRTLLQLVAIARNGFLSELNDVVLQHEKEAVEAVDNFLMTELMILCIGLLILLLEALFIFKPIVKAYRVRTDQLEKSNRELTEFSFRISHDLRSPVSSCKGLIEIAHEAVEDDDRQLLNQVIVRMNRALTKLEVLIEDIIAVTRNSVSETATERVNLREVVNETLDSLAYMKGYSSFRFDVDRVSEQEFFTKKLYLQQILQNLLSNAIKYAAPEGDNKDRKDKPIITVSAKRKGKKVIVSVTDEGPGIPEHCRDKLFGMFNRFHPERAQGSGLGLYLTKQNAIALGGDLDYRPLPSGSEFRLKFIADRAPSV